MREPLNGNQYRVGLAFRRIKRYVSYAPVKASLFRQLARPDAGR